MLLRRSLLLLLLLQFQLLLLLRSSFLEHNYGNTGRRCVKRQTSNDKRPGTCAVVQGGPKVRCETIYESNRDDEVLGAESRSFTVLRKIQYICSYMNNNITCIDNSDENDTLVYIGYGYSNII